MKYLRIGIAGAGNLAWHLAQDLEKAGHTVEAVYSRTPENAALLAAQLYDTRVLEEPDFSDFELDLVLLAVSDDALPLLSERIRVSSETAVAHTSGSVSIEVLAGFQEHYGVFYPVQTFTRDRAVSWDSVPVCLEATSTRVHDMLYLAARSLGGKAVVMDSGQRRNLHLAAVFANNFCNHMLFWSKTLLETEGLDFNLLRPLARETVEKAFFMTPEMAQTGPARRRDQKTQAMHLELMQPNRELQELYRQLSGSIQRNS
jgi:predicted short-subunit dehydrogenase-like oxidoreductase (DUF2520 family)